jgi:hypothetical protein
MNGQGKRISLGRFFVDCGLKAFAGHFSFGIFIGDYIQPFAARYNATGIELLA